MSPAPRHRRPLWIQVQSWIVEPRHGQVLGLWSRRRPGLLKGDKGGNSPKETGDLLLPFLDLRLEILQLAAGGYHACAAACMHHPAASAWLATTGMN